MSSNFPAVRLDDPETRSPAWPSGHGPCRPVELSELLGVFRRRIDEVRAEGNERRHHPSDPVDLALIVVAEALAIGETMSRVSSENDPDRGDSGHIPAVYGEIDSRFLEHRARALRSALHSVDDYVWWGGLAATAR